MLPASSFSTARSTLAVPTRREHRSFADLESMQTIPGWNVRCLQTTAGTLEGGSRDLYLDGIQVLCEEFRNVTTNYFGCAPADSFTIGIARSMKGYGRLDGAAWCEGVCAFDSRRELNSVVPPMQLLSVVVSRRLLCDYIQQTELPTALARSDAKQCTMLWVPLERNDLDAKHPLEERLKKLQCATRDARPVYDFDIVQKGWMEVEQAIRRAVEARRNLAR